MYDLIVIGGGAAGLSAGIAAAECGDRVVILERMDRIGKKILATGNGRCNLMNTGAPRYPGGYAFAENVIKRMDSRAQTRFWESHGLRLREEDGGRVYPACGQAAAVLDVLRLALDNLQVKICTGTEVEAILQEEKGWCAQTAGGVFHGKRLLVAAGGKAQEKLGSNGSGSRLMKSAGVPFSPFRPALTQIETDTERIRGLSGIRARGTIEILHKNRKIHQETGEILFADYGISGVCAMQCARFTQMGDTAVLHLMSGMGFQSEKALYSELTRRTTMWPKAEAASLFHGLCVPRLGLALLKAAGVEVNRRTLSELSAQELASAAYMADHLSLSIQRVKGFATAQVCAGGALCDWFSPDTLECIHMPGLHAAGEVMDVDGDCGGFNLMYAFGSGILAGLNGRKAPWDISLS